MTAEARYIPTGKLIRCPSCSAELAIRWNPCITLERIDMQQREYVLKNGLQQEAVLRGANPSERASSTLRTASERAKDEHDLQSLKDTTPPPLRSSPKKGIGYLVGMFSAGERLPKKEFDVLVNLARHRGWYRYGRTLQEILPRLCTDDDIYAIEDALQAVNE